MSIIIKIHLLGTWYGMSFIRKIHSLGTLYENVLHPDEDWLAEDVVCEILWKDGSETPTCPSVSWQACWSVISTQEWTDDSSNHWSNTVWLDIPASVGTLDELLYVTGRLATHGCVSGWNVDLLGLQRVALWFVVTHKLQPTQLFDSGKVRSCSSSAVGFRQQIKAISIPSVLMTGPFSWYGCTVSVSVLHYSCFSYCPVHLWVCILEYARHARSRFQNLELLLAVSSSSSSSPATQDGCGTQHGHLQPGTFQCTCLSHRSWRIPPSVDFVITHVQKPDSLPSTVNYGQTTSTLRDYSVRSQFPLWPWSRPLLP